MLAPSGTLRVGMLMVWYFALEDKASGKLAGVISDFGRELARCAGVGAELIKLENPGAVMAAFRNNALDITFIGITADRAEVMQKGPTVIDLLRRAGRVQDRQHRRDRPAGLVHPGAAAQRSGGASAQDHHQNHSHQRRGREPQAGRRADRRRTGRRLQPRGPYAGLDAAVAARLARPAPQLFQRSFAVAAAKDRPPAVDEAARCFVEETKASGFVQQAVERVEYRTCGRRAAVTRAARWPGPHPRGCLRARSWGISTPFTGPSSSGPGRRPLTAKTGVRVP
jgi:hypothetical protein